MSKIEQRRQKTCRCGCGKKFTPRSTTQVAATIECAIRLTEKKREKAERAARSAVKKETRAAIEKLKTKRDYVKELDAAFAAFIRYRDRDKPCICCGKPLGNGDVGGSYDAGHFVGRRHMATRWDEANVHGQRKYCNRYLSGNYAGFRDGLIARIGIDEVLRLEAAKHEERRFSAEEITGLRDHYRAKLREMKKLCV